MGWIQVHSLFICICLRRCVHLQVLCFTPNHLTMMHPAVYCQAIQTFFGDYALPQACSLLRHCIKAACSCRIWKGHSPADLLLFMEELELLLEAAIELTACEDYQREAIPVNLENNPACEPVEFDSYCEIHVHSQWDLFPRHLGKKEFLDPFRALQKISRYQHLRQWKKCLRDLLHYALSPQSLQQFDDEINILDIYLLLHKLLEAAHLIVVRMKN